MATADEPELPPIAIRERFLADQDGLSALSDALVAAIEAGDSETTAACWRLLDAGVMAHLDEEQGTVLPLLFDTRPREAHVILQEQRHVRVRLHEVRLAFRDGQDKAAHTARSFVDELAAHLRHEEALLP